MSIIILENLSLNIDWVHIIEVNITVISTIPGTANEEYRTDMPLNST
ncbi:hypothetical protein [Thermococcus sp. 101 C5]|nr:hypothetical protein [Thermococcus sp. 101 C5]